MRLIIIPEDSWVSIDGLGYNGVNVSTIASDVHAVQWFDTEGWIEFKETTSGKQPNEKIISISQFQPVIDSWEEVDYEHKNPPAPEPPTAEDNKNKAMAMLTNTDWTQLPDVQLKNKEEFAVYREQLREIVFNPVAGDIVWPTAPKEVW